MARSAKKKNSKKSSAASGGEKQLAKHAEIAKYVDHLYQLHKLQGNILNQLRKRM